MIKGRVSGLLKAQSRTSESRALKGSDIAWMFVFGARSTEPTAMIIFTKAISAIYTLKEETQSIILFFLLLKLSFLSHKKSKNAQCTFTPAFPNICTLFLFFHVHMTMSFYQLLHTFIHISFRNEKEEFRTEQANLSLSLSLSLLLSLSLYLSLLLSLSVRPSLVLLHIFASVVTLRRKHTHRQRLSMRQTGLIGI